MASHKQKRAWSFVEAGSLLELKSYLRKHRHLDVNFSRGKRERSPLHLACSRGDDAVLRLLLKHGADVLRKDRRGDTALHVAVSRVLKREGTGAYGDLVLPLQMNCPEAMDAPNKAGVTPGDMLDWVKRTEAPSRPRPPSGGNPEAEWQEKLFGECEDEFCEAFGVFDADDFLPVDDEDEDYGDWADRIRREYFDKKHAEAQRLAAAAASSGWRRRTSEQERERRAQSDKEVHERLQREHEEYLERGRRKEEEARRAEKRRYEEGCASTFHGGSVKLRYDDIPWPAPRATVREMVDVMLHGVDRKDPPAFRKALLKQQTLWHPDKFAQRCGARLDEEDKRRVLDTVTALSQELNGLVQSLRTSK
ncbi:NF-kappa-B inhibitor-like protein 1 [Brachionichthys hirsutus]|uniref:NF-kappa-B inhibitor-like protein 1 n=1 Tax=Brachionichthys hirsutus TaxID=412623 RepID=UPI0036044750